MSKPVQGSREYSASRFSLLRLPREPRRGIDLDEIFGPCASGKGQPDRSAFTLHPEINVEERTARALADRPFRDELHGLGIGGKLEGVAIGQFAHGGLQRT